MQLKILEMGNKYYVPQLEDLHIGMEVEILVNTDTWSKEKLHVSHISALYYESKNEPRVIDSLRIKYLSSSDIESEGWQCDNFNKEDFELYFYSSLKEEEGIQIKLDIVRRNVEISYTPLKETLFKGTIKNISEFRRILKMLNIKK